VLYWKQSSNKRGKNEVIVQTHSHQSTIQKHGALWRTGEYSAYDVTSRGKNKKKKQKLKYVKISFGSI
jgi:hypothetical protein